MAVLDRREAVRGGFARARWASVALVLGAGLLLAGTGPARAAMYKWVDDKGVVHYSDKMPPEAVDKASVQLNKEGIPIKRVDKALSPEQRRAIEQEQERQRQEAKEKEEVARRDRALVASYTSEAEIDLARNRAVQTINNVVQSSLAYTEQLNRRRADAEARRAALQGKPMAATLERELESIDSELARQAELIAQKKREVSTVTAKYDADKQRWRELVAAKAASDPPRAANAGSVPNATAASGAGAPKK